MNLNLKKRGTYPVSPFLCSKYELIVSCIKLWQDAPPCRRQSHKKATVLLRVTISMPSNPLASHVWKVNLRRALVRIPTVNTQERDAEPFRVDWQGSLRDGPSPHEPVKQGEGPLSRTLRGSCIHHQLVQ
jgi:hypothetical protein